MIVIDYRYKLISKSNKKLKVNKFFRRKIKKLYI